jgi:peptidoglycan/xylan/chitin deacetylase (PgdA/CDA1 family)
VITYHGVLPKKFKSLDPGFDGSLITAKAFREQIRLLKRRYTIITPDDMRRWSSRGETLPQGAVLLTCDDGMLNNLTEMLPVLQSENLKCLFFVTGASIGSTRTMLWYEELFLLFLRAPAGKFSIKADGITWVGRLQGREQRRGAWWSSVKALSALTAELRETFICAAHEYFRLERTAEFYFRTYAEAERHFGLLTSVEVQQLAAAGMTIGAHTLSHPILSRLSPELAWREIADCRQRLQLLLQKEIWAFAYPFGDASSVSPSVIGMAKRAGFETAFLNVGGGLGSELPLHEIPRVHVNAGMSLAEFEAHVCGFYESLHRLERRPLVVRPSRQPVRGTPQPDLPLA